MTPRGRLDERWFKDMAKGCSWILLAIPLAILAIYLLLTLPIREVF